MKKRMFIGVVIQRCVFRKPTRWVFLVVRQGEAVARKSFSDVKYGGSTKALHAANAYAERMLPRMPEPAKRGRKPRWRPEPKPMPTLWQRIASVFIRG